MTYNQKTYNKAKHCRFARTRFARKLAIARFWWQSISAQGHGEIRIKRLYKHYISGGIKIAPLVLSACSSSSSILSWLQVVASLLFIGLLGSSQPVTSAPSSLRSFHSLRRTRFARPLAGR